MANLRKLYMTGVLLALGSMATLRADVLQVQGTTSGSFFDSGNVNQGDSIHHLTFTGTSFGLIGADQLLTLGSLDLNNGTSDYGDFTFQLVVNFTTPAGTTGSPITGDVSGSVHGNDGSVQIDFSSTPTLFTFGNGGSFDLTINDASVDLDSNGGVGPITGNISTVTSSGPLGDPLTPAAVPEPKSIVLLGTTLLGIFFATRRARLNTRD